MSHQISIGVCLCCHVSPWCGSHWPLVGQLQSPQSPKACWAPKPQRPCIWWPRGQQHYIKSPIKSSNYHAFVEIAMLINSPATEAVSFKSVRQVNLWHGMSYRSTKEEKTHAVLKFSLSNPNKGITCMILNTLVTAQQGMECSISPILLWLHLRSSWFGRKQAVRGVRVI